MIAEEDLLCADDITGNDRMAVRKYRRLKRIRQAFEDAENKEEDGYGELTGSDQPGVR